MALGKNIRALRGRLDWTLEQLSERSGVEVGTISALENRDSKRSQFGTAIAKAMGVSLEDLENGNLDSAQPPTSRALEDDAIPVRMHHVPVVGTTQGGPTTRVWTDGDLPAGDGFGWVSVSSRDRNAFALRVEGSSMAPRYEHGEYVLVEPNRRPEPGDDVIVRLRGGECMIKRLSARRPHELAFDSLSPGYDRITVAPDQIEYLYYVAAGLRAGSYVQHIRADGYEGPERRWHDEPVSVKKRSGDQA